MSSHAQPGAVQIRLAEPAEVIAAIPLVNQAFGVVESYFEGPRTTVAEMEKKLRSGSFLIAKDVATDRTVALVYVELRGERGYFGMLAVDPSRQGAGLGRKMIEAAEEQCSRAGCKFVDIYVLSLRTELPPMYRKFGYAETGVEELHPVHALKPGLKCHIVVMTKAL